MKTLASLVLTFSALLAPGAAWSDGGAPILREARGPLVVTLLVGPVPPRAGPVEFDVLVQSRDTGEPLLSTVVELALDGPDGTSIGLVEARSGVGGNRLFQSARIRLESAGPWRVGVVVRAPGSAAETFRADLDVGPRRGPARRHWLSIAAAPLGLALLALHQALRLSRPGARSRGARGARPSRPHGQLGARGHPGGPGGPS